MDIVHHGFVGGIGLIASFELGIPEAGLTFLMGSAVPDLDVLFMMFGKRAFLRNHQGITHSIAAAPVIAALLSIPFLIFFEKYWDWFIFGGALAGLGLHYLLDYFNTYGLKIFAPFKTVRYRLDATFFVDSIVWALTGGAYLWWSLQRGLLPVYVYVAALFLYHILKLLLHRNTMQKLDADYAIPSSLNPFTFYVLEKHEAYYTAYIYNVFAKEKKNKERIEMPDENLVQLAEKSRLYKDMQSVTRELVITEKEETEDGFKLIARDLAIRNYGGKFGTTTLTFDAEGNLKSEVADI